MRWVGHSSGSVGILRGVGSVQGLMRILWRPLRELMRRVESICVGVNTLNEEIIYCASG